MDKKKLIKIVVAALGGLAVALTAAVGVYMLWEKAPELSAEPGTLTEKVQQAPARVQQVPATEKPDQGQAFDTQRRDGVYTILLVGNDDGNGNTDTIMVAKLDTVRHNINFVSIPRDTLINVDWPIRKLNSVYWGAVSGGQDGITALIAQVKKLLGFEVDCYAVVDLDVFVQAVDAIGGIYFDVPEPVFYEDYWQGLYLDLDAGYQLLDGYQSMCLCRYRSGYSSGDLGRIEMQHQFLKAAADQLISRGSVPNIAEVLRLLANGTDTNLTDANIAYFIRQTLMCAPEDVNFYTAPNTPATVQGYSYAFIDLHDWLELVNSSLNPFSSPVGEGDLDMVYMLGGAVHCTGVLKGTHYFDFGGGGVRQDTELQEEPEPTEETEETAEPPESEAVEPTPAETAAPYPDFLFDGVNPRPSANAEGDVASAPETPAPAEDDWLSLH